MRIAEAQAAALSARVGLPVRVAGRLWAPYPQEVIASLVNQGVTTLISLPLAPQSVNVYHEAVRKAGAAYPHLTSRCAEPWGLEPALIDAFVEAITEALDRFAEAERREVAVILSAHSLPQRAIDAGDPYEQQFRAMAAAVAARIEAGGNRTLVAFQSRGMDGGAWLGPDLPATFVELARQGTRAVVVAAIGFVADHVETLYDLDVEAREVALQAGLRRFERAASMNTRPRFIDALAAVAQRLA